MKRDMDLIRAMLLAVEANEHGFADKLEVEDYTEEQIGYHAYLLGQAGLANVVDTTSFGSESPEAVVRSLTWAGHQFLDSARDKAVWNQAKEMIGKIGSAALEVWVKVLTEIILRRVGVGSG